MHSYLIAGPNKRMVIVKLYYEDEKVASTLKLYVPLLT